MPHVCDTYAACPRGLGQPVASPVAAVALGFGRLRSSGFGVAELDPGASYVAEAIACENVVSERKRSGLWT